MSFEERSEEQIEFENMNLGKDVADFESILFDSTRKSRVAMIKRIKRFLKEKDRPKIRLVIKLSEIIIQDIRE